MNIFNALRVYAAKWQVKSERAFTEEEIDAVDTAKVVDSQYGLSVSFLMKSGGMTYIPLDVTSSKAVGDIVDLKGAKLLTLGRDGDDDIYKVSV